MYTDDPADALQPLVASLRPGDLFLTMGAGDNWKLGLSLLDAVRAREAGK
jgi:UDP-N-acetylmuramate--alanine ligase